MLARFACVEADGSLTDVASWAVEVPRERTLEGRLPISFAATLVAPAPCEGGYALVLSVNGDVVRTLRFTVVDTSVAAEHEHAGGGRADDHRGGPGSTLTGGRPPG